MHRALVLALFLVGMLVPIANSGTRPPEKKPSSQIIAIVGATIWDGSGRPAMPASTLLVRQGRIVGIGPSSSIFVPANAQVIDGEGLFVVPGLIDAHVHFFQSAGLYTRPDILDLRESRPYAEDQAQVRADLELTLRRQLASGLTSVVDMGGPFWNFDVRNRSRLLRSRGEPAPRVIAAGPLISTVSRPQLDLGDPPIIQARDPREAARMARRQIEMKPDFLKVWFIRGGDVDMKASLDILRAVAAEAHRHRLRLAVHATELESARAVVQAGADILVHAVDDEPVDDAFLALLLEKRVTWISTLVVYEGYREVLGGALRPEGRAVPGDTRLDIERRIGDPVAMDSWEEIRGAEEGHLDLDALRKRVERMEARTATMEANLLRGLRAGVPIALGTDAGNIGTLHGPSVHRELELLVHAGFSPEQALLAATRDASRLLSDRPSVGTLEVGKRADLLVLEADPIASVENLRRIRTVMVDGILFDPNSLPSNPEDVVARQVDAYNARDIEAFVAFFAEDAELTRMPDGTPVARGREEIRAAYAELFAKSPRLRCEILHRIVDGVNVIDHEMVHGLRGGPPVKATAVYEVRDGLIRRVAFYKGR